MNLAQFHNLRKPQYGLVVGLPTMGVERVEFHLAWHSAGLPLNCVSQIIPMAGRTVAEARNLITHMAKASGAKYLFFLDDDVIIPPNAFRKLIWDLDNNPHISIAAGIYASKSDPPMPLLFADPGKGPSYDWHKGDFRKVWAIGMGCTIIRIADLAKLDAICPKVRIEDFPGVGFVTECVEYFKDGTAWIEDPEARGAGWALTLTEDLWLCMQAEKIGLNVYADCSVICGHIDMAGNVTDLGMCRPFAPKVGTGDKVYLDVGCGGTHRTFEDGTPFLRVDLDPENKPDYCQDIRYLDFNNDIADGVMASHVLEHLSRHDAELALDQLVRVLKPGGWLQIGTPDIEQIVNYYHDYAKRCDDDVLRSIFGSQTDEFQFHKSGWDKATLTAALERRGMEITKFNSDSNHLALSIWARKKEPCESTSTPSAGTNASDSNTSSDTTSSLPNEWLYTTTEATMAAANTSENAAEN